MRARVTATDFIVRAVETDHGWLVVVEPPQFPGLVDQYLLPPEEAFVLGNRVREAGVELLYK